MRLIASVSSILVLVCACTTPAEKRRRFGLIEYGMTKDEAIEQMGDDPDLVNKEKFSESIAWSMGYGTGCGVDLKDGVVVNKRCVTAPPPGGQSTGYAPRKTEPIRNEPYQMPTSRGVSCTSNRVGNQTYTNCR